MRNWITLFMTCVVMGSASYAAAQMGEVSIEAGYRRDDISWRSRFPAHDPHLATSTKFEDLDIFQLTAQGRATLGCNFYLRASAYWGWILDGNFKRSVNTYNSGGEDFTYSDYYDDYGFDDYYGYGYYDYSDSSYSSYDYFSPATFGFQKRHRSVIDDNYVYGANAAIGYAFRFCDCSMELAPVIGYSFDEQNIAASDHGFDLFDGDYNGIVPVSGSFCCDQKWVSKWYGPFVGLDFNYYPFNDCWGFYASLEYHWGNFLGKRHLNHHEASDYGFDRHKFHSDHVHAWVFSAGIDYEMCNCWLVGLGVKFQDWSTSSHHHIDNSWGYGGHSGRERDSFHWRSGEIKLALGRAF